MSPDCRDCHWQFVLSSEIIYLVNRRGTWKKFPGTCSFTYPYTFDAKLAINHGLSVSGGANTQHKIRTTLRLCFTCQQSKLSLCEPVLYFVGSTLAALFNPFFYVKNDPLMRKVFHQPENRAGLTFLITAAALF